MSEGISEQSNPVAEAIPIESVAIVERAHAEATSAASSEAHARAFMTEHCWPTGLQDTFFQNLRKVPLRFFICDDSSSMNTRDGHKLVTNRGVQNMVACTRWEELSAALRFHAELAHRSQAPTEFMFLNGSTPIRVGLTDEEEDTRFMFLTETLITTPEGGTPLCAQIADVIMKIRPMETELRNAGQKVMVMIASDGESSDGDIVTAMQPLRSLPVWVVVRLCTDDEGIVNYWNDIDSQLELDMDVLDDLSGEAEEVYTANPWLAYGEPLHRLREFGIPIKEIDLLDSTRLSADQIRRFCAIIFGGSMDHYPHPEIDWKMFFQTLDQRNIQTEMIWNPVTKQMTRWINMREIKKLKRSGPSSCSIS